MSPKPPSWSVPSSSSSLSAGARFPWRALRDKLRELFLPHPEATVRAAASVGGFELVQILLKASGRLEKLGLMLDVRGGTVRLSTTSRGAPRPARLLSPCCARSCGAGTPAGTGRVRRGGCRPAGRGGAGGARLRGLQAARRADGDQRLLRQRGQAHGRAPPPAPGPGGLPAGPGPGDRRWAHPVGHHPGVSAPIRAPGRGGVASPAGCWSR